MTKNRINNLFKESFFEKMHFEKEGKKDLH